MTERPILPAAARRALAAAGAIALVGCASVPPDTPHAPAVRPVTTALERSLPTTVPEEPAALLPLSPGLGVGDARQNPLRRQAGADAEDPDARADLWDRVRAGYAMPDLDNERVRKWEQWYASRPDYVQRMTERGGRYLFHIVEEVERRGMPVELALLPFVESAFNPQAVSSARASGMWQFMPATGKDFELKQNVFRDDRRDVLASTRAALDYLQSLYVMFDDWHHALAAYNWGQGNVQRAIARNLKAGQPTDYDSLRMPDETRNYVPKLQAVKNVVLRPDSFGVHLPPLQNHPFFMTVSIDRDIDVALAQRLSGLSQDEFQQLNPQMNKPVILAAGTPQLLLPYDNANAFVRGLSTHRGAFATWTAWVAPKTLKPAEVAQSVGMSEAQLREVNKIPPRMLVRAGSTLLVPRAAHATLDVTEHLADNAAILLAPESSPGRKRTVKAGPKGESVAALARRYRVDAAQLAHWNGVAPGATFKAGQPVLLMVPATKSRAVAKSTPGKRQAKPAPASRTRVAQQ